MMELLKGAPVAEALTLRAKEAADALKEKGIIPSLAVVRVGAREDDLSYERGIAKRFEKAGCAVRNVVLDENVSQAELEKTFAAQNDDPAVHGILLFRPLPKHLDAAPLIASIKPQKDVDCMGPANAAKIYAGDRSGFAPCTALAVVRILEHYGINMVGANATVIGRSAVIGKPVAMLLLANNATVTVCHTKTKNLPEICRNADILVAAAGVAKMVGEEYLSENQVLLDVGIHMTEEGLCGDVDPAAAQKAAFCTPVPGGVGAVTTSVLLQQTVTAAQMCL